MEVRRGRCQLWRRPRHLTMIQNDDAVVESPRVACVACNSESRIGTLSWPSPDKSSMIVRTQMEARFVANHYTSSVSKIPT
ncbi:hypothetical protein TNCV_1814281 [Trichonephila clavipes]|nr:hypothetical protein TNCV_1814281 [Trichonephila clavipes]